MIQVKPRAIIYCSKHGSTKTFAQELGKKYDLPVICIDHISGYSFQNVPVYFCGWVCNKKIKGLKKANRLFLCIKVFALGMYTYNEGYELKLKYANQITNAEFHYIQSRQEIQLSWIEKIYLEIKVHNHEYTI